MTCSLGGNLNPEYRPLQNDMWGGMKKKLKVNFGHEILSVGEERFFFFANSYLACSEFAITVLIYFISPLELKTIFSDGSS